MRVQASLPLRVGPSPDVQNAIRTEIDARNLSVRDRLMPSVSAELVAEPIVAPGWNEGLFYPENAIPPAAPGLALAPSQAVRKRTTTGSLRLLVLLIDFSDNVGQRNAADFQDMLFSQGTYATGSMRDFYHENSYGQLDVDGSVIGWLRMPQPYSYYVNGQNGGDASAYPHNAPRMVEDALAVAAPHVNFAQFDQDGDQFLDGLFVIHAGGGAEADPNPVTRAQKIWSHQWNITQPFVANGVTAYAYLTVPEDGKVGVMCHEFGHMLGLPDLYDTTNHSEGVGVWCVMGAGSWNNQGLTPAQFCAWSKTQLGWITPNVVNGAGNLILPPVEQNRNAVYRLWTQGRMGTEYFLIENRQQVGFDTGLPPAGLLIWHIDDSQHNNNHPGTYWVGLMQSDGRRDLELARNRGDAGDAFPGSSQNTRFDDGTNPSAIDYLQQQTGVAVNNITISGNDIVCDVAV